MKGAESSSSSPRRELPGTASAQERPAPRAEDDKGSTWRSLAAMARDIVEFAGRRAALAAFLVILGAFFEGFGLLLIIPLIHLIDDNTHHARWSQLFGAVLRSLSITTRFGSLAFLLGCFAILMLARGIVLLLRDTTVTRIEVDYAEHVRAALASRLANAEWQQIAGLRHARVLHVLGADTQRIVAAAGLFLQSAVAVVVLLIQCTLSFLLSPAMAVLALALLGAGALLLRPVLRRTRGLGRFASSANVSLADNTAQFLNGLKLALSQNLQARFVTEFRKTLHALSARQLKYVQQQGTARVVVTTLSALACALVFLLGYGVLGLDAAVLIVLLLIISRINGPVLQLQQGLQQLAFGLPAYEAMLELMEELPAAPLQHPRQDPSEQIPRADITLREASFLFPTAGGERRGIHRASFAIATGTWLGIAGESGAGKTTLADMLVGLVRPQSGSLSIGGRAVDEQLLPAWRAHLSYISQDPFLLHDSVRGNLQWADPAATEPDLWDALKLSGADEIVRRMPGGLDAMVGERGVLMSGGERQRIALARALLRKPGLLVMDEATNAIDISGERKLLQALRTLCPSMTVVMIAHRPETLACCDRIVRVVRGIVLDADVAQPPNNECRPVTLEPAS